VVVRLQMGRAAGAGIEKEYHKAVQDALHGLFYE